MASLEFNTVVKHLRSKFTDQDLDLIGIRDPEVFLSNLIIYGYLGLQDKIKIARETLALNDEIEKECSKCD